MRQSLTLTTSRTACFSFLDARLTDLSKLAKGSSPSADDTLVCKEMKTGQSDKYLVALEHSTGSECARPGGTHVRILSAGWCTTTASCRGFGPGCANGWTSSGLSTIQQRRGTRDGRRGHWSKNVRR